MYLELVQDLKKIPFEETRAFRKDYFECVLSLNHLQEAIDVFNRYYGSPVKDAEAKPTDESNRFSALDGGVRKGQTLYLKVQEDLFYCTLIWPWADGIHVTLKVAQRAIADLMPPPPKTFMEKLGNLFKSEEKA